MGSNDVLMTTFAFLTEDLPCSSPKKKRKRAFCFSCQKMFGAQRGLNEHNARFHTQTKQFACNECDKRFSLKRDLDQHKVYHKNKKAFKCEYCDKKYSSGDKLKRHQIEHKQEGIQFKLENYENVFDQQSNYQPHLKLHKVIGMTRDHECKMCLKSFATKYTLKTHMERHTRKVIHQCKMCPKVLSSKYCLKEHMKAHTDGPQIPCKLCKLKYINTDRLKKHMKQKHSNQIENIVQSPATQVAPEPSSWIQSVDASKKMRSSSTDAGYFSQ